MIVTNNRLRQEMVHLISRLKKIEAVDLLEQPNLIIHDLDIVDIVDIILAVERKYNILITDDMPVYTVDDLVSIVEQQKCNKLAS